MRCHGCDHPILSDSLFLVGHYTLHISCMKCVVCQKQMGEGERCFVEEDMVYCRADFLNMYGERCVACVMISLIIDFLFVYCRCVGCIGVFAENELVREVRGKGGYHAHCLRCYRCDAELQDGDSMSLLPSGVVLCERHALESTCVEVSCFSLLGVLGIFIYEPGKGGFGGYGVRE